MVSRQNRWSPLVLRLASQIKKQGLMGSSLLLAVSGGKDSMMLLEAFSELEKPLKLSLGVAYIHHGGTGEYRAQALSFVKKQAFKKGLPFYSKKSPTVLKSEQEMRDFRRQSLNEIREEIGAKWIVLGHHADDLMETRLIRLIRGTGRKGLPAMRSLRAPWYRPFLVESAAQIANEVKSRGLKFLEDPSNHDFRYMRNWIRHRWMPQLEDYRPGAVKALSRSLELLSESIGASELLGAISSEKEPGDFVPRQRFYELPVDLRRQALSDYLRKRGKSDFSYSQIEEVLRHLDKPQKKHTFVGAGMFWTVTADQIFAKLEAVKPHGKLRPRT